MCVCVCVCVRIWYLPFYFWNTSLYIIGSRFILPHQNWFKCISFYGTIIHCIYVPQLLYPFFCRWTSKWWFYVPATVNSTAMNIELHFCFSEIMVFSGYMSSSGISGSCGRFILSFFKRNLYMVLCSGCINCIPTNSAREFPFVHTLPSIYCL